VLAEIAPEQLRSRVEQSRAQVKAADAAVQLAKATLNEAQLELARMRELLGKGLASQRELEASEANATRANASLASTEAQATLARAALRDQQTQLSYTTIRAPFDGIVLSRSVEPGQTVAASLQSPILFTVARDLTKLELLVDVDEADVGRVREGQPATFAVDAWPGRSFESSVQRVHNLPTAGQTVVTYRAVLSVDNSDRSLRPGMTATATITTAHEKSVLLVPNAALRFTPPLPDKPSARPANSIPFMMSPPRLRRNLERSPALQPGEPPSAVWVLEAGQPKRLGVEVGGTDGEWTEVTDQSVSEGQQLVIDIEEPRQP
jgi:HlyD family secretion protein